MCYLAILSLFFLERYYCFIYSYTNNTSICLTHSRSMWGQAFDILVTMSASRIGVSGYNTCPWLLEAIMTAQVIRLLPLTWETWIVSSSQLSLSVKYLSDEQALNVGTGDGYTILGINNVNKLYTQNYMLHAFFAA